MILLGGGLIGILLLALWAYCIFDVISTDEALMRNMPKVMWLIVVILIPTVGAVAWLLLGRPIGAGLRPGDTTPHRPMPRPSRPAPRPLAPDDDPTFLARLDDETRRLRAWEDDLKRREDELRGKDDGDTANE
ncbi:MAG TPA: PLD nuclease N-terminal domain-containing protein [Actinomycetota bacterium]|nr:PLD nuclease N-terminal domain-containing protein [Actinomycetota bacterium]